MATVAATATHLQTSQYSRLQRMHYALLAHFTSICSFFILQLRRYIYSAKSHYNLCRRVNLTGDAVIIQSPVGNCIWGGKYYIVITIWCTLVLSTPSKMCIWCGIRPCVVQHTQRRKQPSSSDRVPCTHHKHSIGWVTIFTPSICAHCV